MEAEVFPWRRRRRAVEGAEEELRRSSRAYQPLIVSACSYKENSCSKRGAPGYGLVKLQSEG